MANPTPVPPEQLLRESSWVRRLALQLAGDAAGADDLEQDTWLRALARPPRGGQPVRGWLATVMRNRQAHRRRAEQRRLHHERCAARPDRGDHDLLERIEAQRAIAALVLALDEPYRTTIVLRYFESCGPAEIADRQGVPVATVKTRLARGLQRLRDQLKRQHGRDTPWLLALAPLLRPDLGTAAAGPAVGSTCLAAPGLASPLTLGILAMNTKVIVAFLAVAATGVTWLALATNSTPADRTTSGSPPQSEDGVPAALQPTDASAAGRRPVESAPRAAVDQPAAIATRTSPAVRGRVLDVRGRPLAGVAVRPRSGSGANPVAAESDAGEDTGIAVATTDAEGWFEFATGAAGALHVDDADYVTVLGARPVAADSGATPVVVAAPRVLLAGLVVAPDATPREGASVEITLPSDLRARIGTVLDDSTTLSWRTTSGVDGSFELIAPAVDGATLIGSVEGLEPHRMVAPTSDRSDLLLELGDPARSEDTLRGLVVDAAGTPVDGATVAMGIDTTTTDTQGRFSFALDAEQSFNRMARRYLEVDAGELRAIKPGHLPAHLPAAGRDADGKPIWPDSIVLRLGGPPLSIAGRVVDERGEPRPGAMVWVADPLFFGGLGDPSTGRFPRLMHCENLIAGAEPGWRSVEADADGRFRLEGLLARSYRVQAMDPSTLLRSELGDVEAGRDNARIVLSSAGLFAELRGTVVDHRGEPVPGVSVAPMCDAFVTRVQEQVAGTYHWGADGTVTEEDGSFVLHDVPRTLAYLRLDGAGTVPLEWGRHVEGGLAALISAADAVRIVVGRRCHFQVELNDPAEADALRILDAQDEPLEVSEFRGTSRFESFEHDIVRGRSNPLAVSDAARTLVLLQDGAEVRRLPIALQADQRTVVRP